MAWLIAGAAVAGMLLGAITAYALTRKANRARRINEIHHLRGQLFDIAKWNSAEFPQYGAAAEDFHNQLGAWLKHTEAGNEEGAWPSLRGGDWFRQNLRTRFEKVPGVITMT